MYYALLVILYSLAVTVVGESLNYYFVYRTEQYRSLKAKIEKLQQTLEMEKERVVPVTKQKQQVKKVEAYEADLDAKNAELTRGRIKTTLAVTAVMISAFYFLNRFTTGIVVMKVPFQPISLAQGVIGRGLETEDITLSSATFVYILASMVWRAVIQRAMGFEAKAPSIWAQAQKRAEKY